MEACVYAVSGGGTITIQSTKCPATFAGSPLLNGTGQDITIAGVSLAAFLVLVLVMVAVRVKSAMPHQTVPILEKTRWVSRKRAIERSDAATQEARTLRAQLTAARQEIAAKDVAIRVLEQSIAELRTQYDTLDRKARAATGGDGTRFQALRALVIKELHPDGKPSASPIERLIRGELFKTLWPEIQRIDTHTSL